MKNKKQTKNLIWMIIQLIYLIFSIINKISHVKGSEFLEDFDELLEHVKDEETQEPTASDEN